MGSWFDTARFGVFIHWSHISKRGWEISWPLMGGLPNLPYCQKTSAEEYNRGALDFNPTNYDPRNLARRIKNMGAQYAIITAKHHDGFAMYPTKLSDWSIAKSRYGKDIVGPFVEAVRAEGLHVGLYFSLVDWHHPDYPTWKSKGQPYDAFVKWLKTPSAQWKRYIEFMFGQVRELLTSYGKIDVLWFDGQWEVAPWKWKPLALRKMIKSLQPDTLVNDRLPFTGGYETPEQFVPQKPPKKIWETCMTMNESWGYNKDDHQYKSARTLIQRLCEVASKGGNLLLNISPMGDGTLPPEQIERIDAVTEWMAVNRESIVGTTPGLEPWQFYGPSTRHANKYYLHLVMQPYETVSVRGIKVNRVKSVKALKNGSELKREKKITIANMLLKNPDPIGEMAIEVPREVLDEYVTVMVMDFQ